MSERDLADQSLLPDDGRCPSPFVPADAAVSDGPLQVLSSGFEPKTEPGASHRQPANDVGRTTGKASGKGRAFINAARLRQLRESRLLSQQDLADDFHRRRQQVSIATIKRAETGHAVRYRIVRELALYFEVPCEDLL